MAGPRIFSLNPSRFYSSIGIGILLLASQGALAQYSLPKLSILVDNKISSIHLSKVALRMENKMNEDLALDSVDHTPFHLNTFFINPQGWIDSIYYYPTTTAYDKKVFTTETQMVLCLKQKSSPPLELLSHALF